MKATRFSSNKANVKFFNKSSKLNPVITYLNCEIEKDKIFSTERTNKGKAVIYRWINNINKKTYIGSSVNLNQRLYKYYSVKHLHKYKTPIHNALLKYGYSNFNLEILEYCEKKDSLLREQFYFDLLKPDYNILKIAGSSIGFKHSEKTLDMFRNKGKASEETRKNLSLSAKGRVLTEADKKKISISSLGKKLSAETRAKISATVSTLIGVSVIVKNITTNSEIEYSTLTEAAKAIGVSRTAVKKAVVSNNIFKQRYYIALKNK